MFSAGHSLKGLRQVPVPVGLAGAAGLLQKLHQKRHCRDVYKRQVVRTLGTELVRDYGTDKPVVLVGRYTLGENITRYTTADPMQHPLYRFFRERCV